MLLSVLPSLCSQRGFTETLSRPPFALFGSLDFVSRSLQSSAAGPPLRIPMGDPRLFDPQDPSLLPLSHLLSVLKVSFYQTAFNK